MTNIAHEIKTLYIFCLNLFVTFRRLKLNWRVDAGIASFCRDEYIIADTHESRNNVDMTAAHFKK